MSIKEFLEKKGLIKEYEEFKINISKKRQKESTKKYLSNPINNDRYKEIQKKYREKNKDKINKISLKSYYKRKEEKIDIL